MDAGLAYDGSTRSDYASTKPQADAAWIKSVEEGSPAWEAGLEPGMRVDRVNGHALLDIIDWRWEASDDVAELEEVYPYASAMSKEDEAYKKEAMEATSLCARGHR